MKHLLLIASAALALTACDVQGYVAPSSVRAKEAEKAARVANAADFSAGNAEVDNISKRQQMVSDPGLIGFVLITSHGTPVGYYQSKGKITSCGKRLENPEQLLQGDVGESYGDYVMEAPSYDGTFGQSDPNCYFFFTVNGAYVQSNLTYVYSNSPLALDSKTAASLVK